MKLKALQTACSGNEQKYLQSGTETKAILASGSMEKTETLLANINGITNWELQNFKNVANLESKEAKLEELRENRANLFEMMKDEKRSSKLKGLQELYKKVQFVIKKLESQIKLGGIYGNEEKQESMKEILRENKVGIPGESPFPGMLYDSPDAVHKKLHELKWKINNFEQNKVILQILYLFYFFL